MRLADEKELSDNATALYQTQAQVLTDLFKTLTNDAKDPSTNPLGIVADVRNEVLLLQALSETAQNDRNVMRSKMADMENQLLNRDQYELQLKQQLAELWSQNDALELKFRSLRDSALFHDAQLISVTEEKKADARLAENYRSQLEDALLMIDHLQDELAESSEDVQTLKNRLGKLQDDQDRADLTISFDHLMAGTRDFATAETQTMWTVAAKKLSSEMPRQKSSRQLVKPKVSEKQTMIQLPATPRDSPETIRITRVEYVAPEKPPQPRSFVSPISRSTLQSDPMFITGPSKGFTGMNLDEIAHLTHRMRDRIAELEAALSKSDRNVIDLRRRLVSVCRDRQRLDMDLARCQDQEKRAQIRYANAQTRLEVAMNELGVREDDNYHLRREIVELKQKMASPHRSLAHIEHSRTEQDIVKREKRQQKMVIAAAQMALDNIANNAIRAPLERLLENSQKSVARLEAKRRMWQEIERKQVFAALSALSLVHDTQFSGPIESFE
jgi:chromosome segregation ATPase